MSEKSLENPYESQQSFVGVIVDSTEMKILQEQLSQAQKIESIGQLAGGIAHDFNNLLTIIGGNLEILQFKKLSGKPFDKQLEHIRQASVRAKTLVAQILAFSRQEKLQLGPVNLSTLVGESLSFLRSIIPTTVEVITRVPDEVVTINANTTQLQRILINICSNALHAMNEKGVLKISLEEAKLTTEETLLVRGQQASRYAKLSIIDTGKGMDKKILDRIFEPFFTTKGVGDGTGMGLSVVHGIVEQHGGFIDVDSTPDQGTTFILYFPTNTIDKETDKAEVEGILPTGTERVLCVDDEQDVADVCSVMLEHLGYQVTVATDSVEALNLFKANPESFDLIVTDQTMPKISGLELAKELLAIRPEIPVILCSGYSAIVTETDALEVGVRAFCAKPMDMKQLGSVVREVLDTSEQPLVTA
jgi:nitrogen-specific signal transduction histidine kinase/CheY-like chemotaxis protein